MDFESLTNFIKLTHAFQQIRREIFVTGEDRQENDLEHSGQLALVAWYIADSNKLPLDTSLVMKYALVHDLVEVYAGDTYIFADESYKSTKREREEAARIVLIEKFPEFPELHELILGYEHQINKEAEFVYALDKLLPAMNIYLDDGRTWRTKPDITFDRVRDYTYPKVAVSPDLEPYYARLVKILESDQSTYFTI